MAALNFTKYLVKCYVDPKSTPQVLLKYVNTWVEETQDEWLAGLEHTQKKARLKKFTERVQAEAELLNRQESNLVWFNVTSRLDNIFKLELDSIDASQIVNPIDLIQLGPPRISHSNDYLTAGVACTGAIINASDQLVGNWKEKDTYSGNHSKGKPNPYIIGDGSSGPSLRTDVPVRNRTAYMAAKPSISTGLKLLNDERHAEDGWFAYYFEDFYKAVNLLPKLNQLPLLSSLSIAQQAASKPRVEFLQSMPPCALESGDPHSGCRRYFHELRKATSDRIPIIIYCYRPYETPQQKKQVFSIDAAGNLIAHNNSWAHTNN